MSELFDEMTIKYPPLNEAQAAVLAPHLAKNPAFIAALLSNEEFVRRLADVLGIPERNIRYPSTVLPFIRRCVRTIGPTLLQVHWGLEVRVANALWQSHLSIPQMLTAERSTLSRIRNLGDKYVMVLMEQRKPIPYRALRFAPGMFDKARLMLERIAETLRISYCEVEDGVFAFTTDTFDRAVELFDANDIFCHEIIVIGDPPVVQPG